MTPPLVQPFEAERFDRLEDLSKLIAPPYDVISAARRGSLAAQDRTNVVNLTLPEGDDDRYTRAADILRSWRREGVLVPDGEQAVYVLVQEFTTPDGRTCRRTGVIAAVLAEPFDGGRIKPHERTHKGPREDRLALLRATQATFESLFMVARDESGDLGRALAETVKEEPMATATLDAVTITLWRVTGTDALSISSAAGQGPLYIADGHHRYETAVAFAQEYPHATRLPVLIVPIGDSGLVVLPTHRMVGGRLSNRAPFVDRMRERFQIRELPSTANYVEELRALRDRGTSCIVVFGAGPALALLMKGGVSLGDLPFANEPTVASLDVARIDALVVDQLKELAGNEPLTYSADAHEVIDAVHSESVAAGVLLNPTAIEDVLAVADAGAFMPPKSTYFMPKVPSGLVTMAYDQGATE